MTRSVTGSTFPNDGREWFVEQMLRDVAGPVGATTYIHYQVCQDPWTGSGPSADNAGVYGLVRGGPPAKGIPAMPQQAFHVRFYDRGEAHQDVALNHPDIWAERVAHMLISTRYGWASLDGGGNERLDWRVEDLTQDPYVVVSGYNEPNLEWGLYIGRTPDAAFYREWAERELAFFQALDKLLPSRKCLWASSAPAYGHDAFPDDPDSEWPVIQATGLLDYVDLVQLHVYAVEDVDPASGPSGANAYWHSLRPWRVAGYDTKRRGTNRPADRGGVLTQFGDRYRYFVSEWNTFSCNNAANTAATIADHKAMLNQFAATPAIVAATSFIWLSGNEHLKNIIALNETLRTWHEHAQALNTAAAWPSAKWNWQAQQPPDDPGGDEPVATSNPYGYLVGGGMAAEAESRGWTILSDEIYHDPADRSNAERTAFSECFCDKGRLYYHAATGTVAVPFE